MNYISQLQLENGELQEKLTNASRQVTLFMAFLQSPKFTGTENGERKDWIATSDVQSFLSELRKEIQQ